MNNYTQIRKGRKKGFRGSVNIKKEIIILNVCPLSDNSFIIVFVSTVFR